MLDKENLISIVPDALSGFFTRSFCRTSFVIVFTTSIAIAKWTQAGSFTARQQQGAHIHTHIHNLAFVHTHTQQITHSQNRRDSPRGEVIVVFLLSSSFISYTLLRRAHISTHTPPQGHPHIHTHTLECTTYAHTHTHTHKRRAASTTAPRQHQQTKWIQVASCNAEKQR